MYKMYNFRIKLGIFKMSIYKILPADKVYHFIESTQYNHPIFFFYLKLLKEEETFNGETEAKDRNGVQLSREPSDASEMQVRLHAGISLI